MQEIEGVAGIHVMAYRQEELVAEIVHDSGVLRGRKPWKREPRPDDAVVVERLEDILTEAGETVGKAAGTSHGNKEPA